MLAQKTETINENIYLPEPHEWVDVPIIGVYSGHKNGLPQYEDQRMDIGSLIGDRIPEGYSICGSERLMAGTPLMRCLARSQGASWSDDLEQQSLDVDLQAEILRIKSTDNPTKALCNQYAEVGHYPEDIHRQYSNMSREETWLLESSDSRLTLEGISFRIDDTNPEFLRVRGLQATTNWVATWLFDADPTAEEWAQAKVMAFMLRVVNDTDDTKANQWWVETIKDELDRGITTTFLKLQEITDHFLLMMGEHDPETGYAIIGGDILPHKDMSITTTNTTEFSPVARNDWSDSDNRKYDDDMVYTFRDFAKALNDEMQHCIRRVSVKPSMVQWRKKANIKVAKGNLFFETLKKELRNNRVLGNLHDAKKQASLKRRERLDKAIALYKVNTNQAEAKRLKQRIEMLKTPIEIMGDHPFETYGDAKVAELCWRLYDSATQNPKCMDYVTPDMSIQHYYRNAESFRPRKEKY